MKAVSLFTGAGGMDIGFSVAGFDTVLANELDAYACQTFRQNHIDATLLEGDLKTHIASIGQLQDIDVVFGGPPCQGFSVAGKMDHNDPRSGLIFSFAEVIEKVRPRAFVMENVKALGVLSKFSNVREALVSKFMKAGYTVSMHILNAKDFGVPQSRERVFFIGLMPGLKPITQRSFIKHRAIPPTLREALTPLGAAGTKDNARICNAKITLAENPILRKSPYAGMLFNGQGRPLNPDGWASTLPASMGGNRTPIIDEKHLYENAPSWVESYHNDLIRGCRSPEIKSVPHFLRRLTIDEASLLQGFPKDYKFHGPISKVFTQIGNAVPCKLAEVVARVVKNALEEPEGQSLALSYGDNYELELIA